MHEDSDLPDPDEATTGLPTQAPPPGTGRNGHPHAETAPYGEASDRGSDPGGPPSRDDGPAGAQTD